MLTSRVGAQDIEEGGGKRAIESSIPPYITIRPLLTSTEAGDTTFVEINVATPLHGNACLTFEIDAHALQCIALSAPRAQLNTIEEEGGGNDEEVYIAKELEQGLPYAELRYRKDRKALGFKHRDADGKLKRFSRRITLDHHGSMIPSELAALCE